MADEKKEAPKPTPPPPKPASAVSVKAQPIVPKIRGFDLLRPFRYAFAFTKGTAVSGLDVMANWGRKGSRIGAVVGLLLVVSGTAMSGGLGLIAAGWMAGLVIGAATGGVVGVASGGIRAMDRETRKEVYADDLMRKAEAKSRPQSRVDYRDAHREYKQRSDFMLDRYLQQEREIDRDSHRYFQDRVNHSRSNGGGYGQGF